MSVSEALVRARKRHWCEEYGQAHRIEPGEDYVRAVAFPDGEVNTGDRPWVMRICCDHFLKYGRTLPARKTRPIPPESSAS